MTNTFDPIGRGDNSLSSNNPIQAYRLWLSILLVTLVGLGLLLNLSHLDLRFSEHLADGLNGFVYSKHWFFDNVLHIYAARLTAILGLGLLLFNAWQALAPSANRKIIVVFRYIMFSWLSSLAVISVLKRITTLPCPWDLKQFGGMADYLTIEKMFSSMYEVGECFPAAHSSGGYGFICLGFVALALGKPMYKGFLCGVIVGLVYGGAQIIRGAHFISHDLFTIAICLAFAWFWAEFYLFRFNEFHLVETTK